ncbi:MAG: PAS domain-containing protein [Candidatus Aminicenantes bacterium]|nr:PAS domain-containing protein [Candidatus Aminicenantes bacterium]
MRKTLFLRIFSGYAAVIVLLAFAVTFFAPPLMRSHHIEEQAAGLEHLALLLEEPVLPYLTGRGAGDLGEIVTRFGKSTGRRITVIDREGKVLADSEKGPGDMDNHFFRPEIQAALRGEKRMSIRESSTLKTEMMYMSIPLKEEGRVVGVLRLSLFMKDFEGLMGALRRDLLKIVGLVTLFALGLAIYFARSVSAPIREFIDASSRVSAGDFEAGVSTRRSGEFRSFALSFNKMVGKLKAMFTENQLQNEEIESILASIREGLCVLDKDSRIVLCNEGFRRIVQDEAPEGKHLWEVVRSSSLSEVVRKVLDSRTPAVGEATIGDRIYLCNAGSLVSGDRVVITLRDKAEISTGGKAGSV